MSKTDRTTMAVVAGACVVCCLPLIVAAGPVVAAAGVVAAGTGAVAHVARRTRRKRDAATSDNP
jgi:hypothetical protein